MEKGFERVERILAILLLNNMKGASQREKAVVLNLAGFSNIEIADVLQTNSKVVSQHLYTSRKTGRSKKR